MPGSREAIARLCKAGWTVAVATNQSGVALGKFDLSTLGDMHFKMQQLVMEQGACVLIFPEATRVPVGEQGKFSRSGAALAVNAGLPVLPIAHNAGMLLGGVPYLVRTGKGLRTQEGTLPPDTQVFDDLAAVVDHLLESSR